MDSDDLMKRSPPRPSHTQRSGVVCSTAGAVALVAVSGVILVCLIVLYYPFTVDDSFITFRYAANLAAGCGPVYNAGTAPAEGYSSPLWVLMMAVPHLIGVNVVTFSKACGIVATLLYLGLAFVFASHLVKDALPEHRWASGAAVVLMLSCSRTTAVHAVSGMETALFTLLALLLFYALALCAEKMTRLRSATLAVLGFLLGLTRPEGNLLVFAGLVILIPLVQRGQRGLLAKCVFLLYLLPAMVYFSWRVQYYGHVFPLPFYLKAAHAPVFAGARSTASFVGYAGSNFGFLATLAVLYIGRNLLPPLVSGLALVAFYVFPAHIMGYDYRYLSPLLPLIAVIAGVGVAVLLSMISPWTGSASSRARLPGQAVAVGVCLLVTAGLCRGVPGSLRDAREYAEGLTTAHIALGKYLRGIDTPGRDPVIAIGDAGAVPYYSQWHTIDIYGLNEPAIALSGRHDPKYVLSWKPDIVVVISRTKGYPLKAAFPWCERLYEESRRRGMTRIKVVTFQDDYFLWLMAYPETSVAQRLREWVQPAR